MRQHLCLLRPLALFMLSILLAGSGIGSYWYYMRWQTLKRVPSILDIGPPETPFTVLFLGSDLNTLKTASMSRSSTPSKTRAKRGPLAAGRHHLWWLCKRAVIVYSPDMAAYSRFYTYILSCADGSLYTGWTDDLERRINVHNQGKGARYTRARLPVTLLAHWSFDTKQDAMRFEWKIKQLPRKEKLRLIGCR